MPLRVWSTSIWTECAQGFICAVPWQRGSIWLRVRCWVAPHNSVIALQNAETAANSICNSIIKLVYWLKRVANLMKWGSWWVWRISAILCECIIKEFILARYFQWSPTSIRFHSTSWCILNSSEMRIITIIICCSTSPTIAPNEWMDKTIQGIRKDFTEKICSELSWRSRRSNTHTQKHAA